MYTTDSVGQSANDLQVSRRVGVVHASHLLESTSGHAQCGRGDRATSCGRRRGTTGPAKGDRWRRETTRAHRKSRDLSQWWRQRRRPRLLHDIARLLPTGQERRLSWNSTPVYTGKSKRLNLLCCFRCLPRDEFTLDNIYQTVWESVGFCI